MAALGRLTCLSSLSMDWRLGPVKAREPAAPPLPALPEAAGLHLLSLTSLTSLRMVFLRQSDDGAGPSEQVPRGAASLTVAPLWKLRRLGLPGCSSIGLALSVGRLGATLEELDLSCCSAAITPGLLVQVRHKREARPLACISSAINLDFCHSKSVCYSPGITHGYSCRCCFPTFLAVTQVCSQLPLLTALNVGNCEWASSFALPGDVLLSGLAAVCPLLRTLRMQGIKLHGTGLCPGGPGGAPGLPLLCDLVLDGSRLLRGRIGDIGELRHLQRLTLTNMMSAVGSLNLYKGTRCTAALPLSSILCGHCSYLWMEISTPGNKCELV